MILSCSAETIVQAENGLAGFQGARASSPAVLGVPPSTFTFLLDDFNRAILSQNVAAFGLTLCEKTGIKLLMKPARYSIVPCVGLFLVLTLSRPFPVFSQAFHDLNFEAASIPPSTPITTFIPISEALPGWSAYFTSAGGVNYPQTQVGYDWISTGGEIISVIDKDVTSGPLQGKYSAFLFGGLDPSLGLFSASISQTGLVPTGTESLLFDAFVYAAPFTVTLGGQTINMTPLETFANYTEFGGNIPSSFDGQSEALTFTEPPGPGAGESVFELDNISFSQTAVTPEPSPLILTSIGGLIFALRRRFRQK